MTDLPRTPAWQALEAHAGDRIDIAQLIASEPGRMENLALNLDGALFDFSKNLVSEKTIALLAALARQQNIEDQIARMMAGDKINNSESRAAWHTALRAPKPSDEIASVLARMEKFAQIARQKYTDVVHIGIGGSDLGPRMVCRALTHDIRIHFAADTGMDDLSAFLQTLDPDKTLMIAASKSFTTRETVLQFNAACDWLGSRKGRMVAITANAAEAQAQGIAPENIFPMWDWVGGRFSVWSAIGLPIVIGCGFEAFKEFLAGAHLADMHTRQTPIEQNIPALMALLEVWYRNFLKLQACAVLPYTQRLSVLPAWLQQLEMESNGKRVDRDGKPCTYATAPVILGEVGPNAQHAFMQMLHQGNEPIPCDFIGMADMPGTGPSQSLAMANMLAQARGLMLGGGDTPHASCPGNRPSTTILLPTLNARTLGLLMAVYEHKTAIAGFLWNLNSFDQFGVELGKTLAKELLAPTGKLSQNEALDKSTNKLIFHTFTGK